MNATLKHAFFSGALFFFVLSWAVVVSASPFLMMSEMHMSGMECLVAAGSDMACPMNLVEQIDHWSDSFAVLSLLVPAAFIFLNLSTGVFLALIWQRSPVQESPPGISWLERIQEHWALAQGILNPKRPHMQHV